MRLSLVNSVGDDVKDCNCADLVHVFVLVCQVSCIFLRIPDFINEDTVDFTMNVTKKL